MATVYAVYVFVHVQLRDLKFLIKKLCSFLDSTENRESWSCTIILFWNKTSDLSIMVGFSSVPNFIMVTKRGKRK